MKPDDLVHVVEDAAAMLDAVFRELDLICDGRHLTGRETLPALLGRLGRACREKARELRRALPAKPMTLHATADVVCAEPGCDCKLTVVVPLDLAKEPAAVEAAVAARLRMEGWTQAAPFLCILHNEDRGN